MGMLDIAKTETKQGRRHYRIDVDGKSLAYCYIRKNACSAFKEFLIAMSPEEIQPEESDIEFLTRAHTASMQDVKMADYRICILRDPIDRAVSLYVNKFVIRSGNADIFSSYEKLTGQKPNQASFRDFVEKYLSLPFDVLDGHVVSQSSHLIATKYNAVFMMDQLYFGMSEIIGTELAQQYFSVKVNSTKYTQDSHSDCSQETADGLRHSGQVPTRDQLCTDELSEIIRSTYAEDYNLIARLNAP